MSNSNKISNKIKESIERSKVNQGIGVSRATSGKSQGKAVPQRSYSISKPAKQVTRSAPIDTPISSSLDLRVAALEREISNLKSIISREIGNPSSKKNLSTEVSSHEDYIKNILNE